jgi:signal transduction histidine kinase
LPAMQRVLVWMRIHAWVLDALLGCFIVWVGVEFHNFYDTQNFESPPFENAGWLAPVLALPVFFRNLHLIGALYASVALGFVGLVFDVPPASGLVMAMAMAYSAAAYAPRAYARAAVWVVAAGSIIGALRWAPELGFGPFGLASRAAVFAAAIAAPMVISLMWGGLVRARAAQLQQALDLAERLRRQQDIQARLAVIEERARIAREMHDVVAHRLSVIVLQSDGAGLIFDSDPHRAKRAITMIGQTGRDALAEMRGLLGLLRHANGTDPAAPADLRPQPGVPDIAELIDRVREAGLRVEFEQVGDLNRVPVGVGLAAYRIVQESLTNIVKHAGPNVTVHIRLECRDSDLLISIADDGRGASAINDGAGHGLTGMRERATAVGGQVRAGPQPGGGFLVSARLPRQVVNPSTRVTVPEETR